MKYIKIYKIGLIVLLAALAINALATMFGFMNWYQFISNPGDASIIDYIWLFIGYPFCLGLAVFIIFIPQKNN